MNAPVLNISDSSAAPSSGAAFLRLYHFTCGEYLRGIARCGLTVGDVPTDIYNNSGTIGVWFTSLTHASGHGLEGGRLDKKRFRLAVDVPQDRNLAKWTQWAPSNVTPLTQAALENAGSAETWFIYFGHISPQLIAQVVDMRTGLPVRDWQTIWPETDSLPGVKYEGRFVWQKRMLADVRRVLKSRCAA